MLLMLYAMVNPKNTHYIVLLIINPKGKNLISLLKIHFPQKSFKSVHKGASKC